MIDATELAILVAAIGNIPIPPFIDVSKIETLRLQLGESSVSHCAAAAFVAVGALLRMWCYRRLGRFFTFKLSIREEHRLVKDGPYGVVRHPSYSGAFLVIIGNAWYSVGPSSTWRQMGLWGHLVGFSVGMAVIMMSVYFLYCALIRIPGEDEMLRRRFREEWDAWAMNTPYRIVPYVY